MFKELKKHQHHRFLYDLGCLVLLYVSGCRSLKRTTGPEPVRVTVSGTSNLNSGGNAAFVHVYELTSETNFRNAVLESFWQDPDAALGQERVESRQIRLNPGQDTTFVFNPAAQTLFVGVAANLRQPDREQWRQIYPVSGMLGKQLYVVIGETTVTASVR
jgi:type VI secretion system VasD/TssJ family lipoprotein